MVKGRLFLIFLLLLTFDIWSFDYRNPGVPEKLTINRDVDGDGLIELFLREFDGKDYYYFYRLKNEKLEKISSSEKLNIQIGSMSTTPNVYYLVLGNKKLYVVKYNLYRVLDQSYESGYVLLVFEYINKKLQMLSVNYEDYFYDDTTERILIYGKNTKVEMGRYELSGYMNKNKTQLVFVSETKAAMLQPDGSFKEITMYLAPGANIFDFDVRGNDIFYWAEHDKGKYIIGMNNNQIYADRFYEYNTIKNIKFDYYKSQVEFEEKGQQKQLNVDFEMKKILKLERRETK